jgi:trigger factor
LSNFAAQNLKRKKSMSITQESTGDLTATIKIEMVPDDYQEQVNNSLKDIQKKSTLKGFRPGKVPFGLIKKMYEQNAVAEEVNKVLSDSLNNYIVENKLGILGYPIANTEKNTEVDFESNKQFEFFFDIGLSPSFDLELSDKIEVDYYDIQIEDKMVDNFLEETKKRYGNPVNPEKTETGDLVKGEITQIDADGNIVEDGVTNATSVSIEFLKDEKVKKEFIGKAVGDKIQFNPLKATENETETASMLGIKKEDKDNLESDYEFTITEISRIEPAEVNEELFIKVYPNDDIKDEKQFREKLRDEAKAYYQNETDNYFVHLAMDKLIHDTKIDLPDEFVKRWLVTSDEKITQENIDKDYDSYAHSLKQQLIINKIAQDNDLKVEPQEIKNHVKSYFAKQYMIDESDEEKMKQLDTLADSVLQNKDEANKIFDQLFDNKMRELFKSTLKLNKIEKTYEEFIKIANEHQHKHHHHEHE